jgi:hypothetical protein
MTNTKNILFSVLLILNLVVINSQQDKSLDSDIKLIEQISSLDSGRMRDEIEVLVKGDNNSDNKPQAQNKREMKINSNLLVLGDIQANKIVAEKLIVNQTVNVSQKINSEIINTTKLTANILSTERIVSPTGVITIEADLVINNDMMGESVSMRGDSFYLEGVKQWGLTHHDDFETEKSLEGWSDKRISKCKNATNSMLGGHCNFSYNEVSKTFTDLPKHEKIKINAAFHMLDSWDGETAFMKVDGETVWTKKGQHSQEKGIDVCGGEHNDPAFNLSVDVTIPHNKQNATITFGSTLDEEPCNESFGVDDVMIYVR